MAVLHSITRVTVCVWGVLGVLAMACASAHADIGDASSAPRLEVESVPAWDFTRRDGLPGWSSNPGAAGAAQRRLAGLNVGRASDDGLRARWWWGSGGVEIGAGADLRATSVAAVGAQPWSHVLGVRATLSSRTSLVYETASALPWGNADATTASRRTSRVALEFKSRKSPVSNLRDGLMRVQLSGDADVQFKPRGGGLQVMYRERF